MCLSAVLGVGSALIGGRSASKAADAQQAAADQQVALQRESRDMIADRLDPYLRGGTLGQQAYMYELGLGERPMIGGTAPNVVEFQDTIPATSTQQYTISEGRGQMPIRNPEAFDRQVTRFRVGDQVFGDRDAAQAYADANPTGGTPYQGFQKTPGYDFRLQQGLDAIEASEFSKRGLGSGAMAKRLTEYGQDYATNEYSNYLNRLAGVGASGQNAAGMMGAADQYYAGNASNALAGAGNAAAAGAIAQGNAWQGGINNLAGYIGYQKTQPGGNASIFDAPWGSSGFWS